MDLVKTLDLVRIKPLQDNIVYLDENRDKIIIAWTSVEDVSEVLTKHDVDIEMFQTTYAHPVLNYFIGVVNGEQEIGNCPVIAKLLEYLQEKHITSSELFIICINFRKSIIRKMFLKERMTQELYDSIAYVFDANFRGVLELFSDSIAKVKEETDRLYELSIRDHLTGIFNRKMFDEILSLEIKNTKRNKTDFSLILFDIDHFKAINDTFGHDTGDNVLINLSSLVQTTLRDSDVLARWGGEEFVVLMPKSNKENSFNKANKIRALIENYQFESIPKITCSFGVVEYEEDDSESSIFQRADQALYISKSEGRNKVTFF